MPVYTFALNPVGAPRQTGSDRWRGLPGRTPMRPCIARYRAFRDALRLQAAAQGFTLPERYAIRFLLPIPGPKYRSRLGKPHQMKPDLDNLLKAFQDALTGEDQAVWRYERAEKVWAWTGGIEVRV